jgi:hypothetical protein
MADLKTGAEAHRRLSARNATFGGERPECAGKRTFVCSSAKVSYVPTTDSQS